jgi:hypothetical protein
MREFLEIAVVILASIVIILIFSGDTKKNKK